MIVTGRMILAGLDVLDRLFGGASPAATPRPLASLAPGASFAQTMEAVRKTQKVFALPPEPSERSR